MSDNTLNKKDDDDIIVVEEGEETQKGKAEEKAEPEDDDDDDGDDDTRLGDNADDSDDEITDGTSAKNAKKRKKQKDLRRRAKENAERELQFLRQQNDDLMRRVQAVEGHAVGTNVSQLDAQLAAVQNEIRQAEYVIGKAVEAGNGNDVTAAIRLRDEANQRAQQILHAKNEAENLRQQVSAPRADPRVISYAQEWHKANPWYDPNGRDEQSLITKAVDNALAIEGYNPSTEAYWHELTKRVAKRIGGESAVNKKADKGDKSEKAKKRQAPPMGTDREHTPASSRNEIFVSKDRKAAMVEAGVWDDPVRRNKLLKAYQAYDRGASR